MKEVGKGSRRRGTLALILGTIGALLAIAVLVLSILFTVGANNAVDSVEERIIQPVDRLTEQIDETSAAVANAAEGEVEARLASLIDQAASAEEALDAITEHPLYANVPVDIGDLEDRLGSVTERAGEFDGFEVEGLSDDDREEIAESLTELAEPLDDIEGPVERVADSLRFWIRISGLGFVLLSLWAVWAQLALARHGRQTSKKSATPEGQQHEA